MENILGISISIINLHTACIFFYQIIILAVVVFKMCCRSQDSGIQWEMEWCNSDVVV